MPDEYLKIAGGMIHDPANGVDGVVGDLWICNGVVVAPPQDSATRPARTLDVSGMVVMPGGVDMHCHIAGTKVNSARKLCPEEKEHAARIWRGSHSRSGTMGSVPSTFATGYRYAGLGYTTAMEAAVAPLTARHAHDEFADTPCIDKGFYVLLGNNHFAMKSIADGDLDRLRDFVAWQLSTAKGYAVKLVNPGGVEAWKQQAAGNVAGLDESVEPYDVTPRQIVRGMASTVDQLGLPHPVHLHCNNLGMPGNWATTLETMRALEGCRAHLTHIQFHSYGGGDADETTFGSKVVELAEYFNAHDHVSADVGQVLFGDTTSMTADAAVGHFLANIYGTKWFNQDIELEAGCGIAPITYRDHNLVHAWQWAIGLEWFLLVRDPWRIAMSTDHPNGGSFLAYPRIIEWLMDRNARDEALARVHPRVAERSSLHGLDREYSLNEIAIITRAGPARMLGLTSKGHLGVGADADITVYTPSVDRLAMFSLPRYVIQAGKIIVEQGELRGEHFGQTLHVAPKFDGLFANTIREWFEQHYSVRFENYAAAFDHMERARLRSIPS